MCTPDEFHLRNFKLTYSNGKDFAVSPWLPIPCVVGYRLVITLYCSSWIIYSIISGNSWKWLIYLTDWTFLCVTTYFVWSTLISVIYWAHCHGNGPSRESGQERAIEEGTSPRRETSGNPHNNTHIEPSESVDGLLDEQYYDACEDTEQMEALEGVRMMRENADSSSRVNQVHYSQTWYHKVAWFFYIVAANNSILVTVVYWSFLYTDFKIREADVAFHLLNSVFMLTETCVSAIPVRVFHVVYAMLYGVIYLTFTVVYWLNGGTNIYPILNYKSEPYAATVLVILYGLVGLPTAQLFNFGLFRLRCYLHGLRGSE
ncbi:hypothetical protein ACROYT_G033290 [Oculina patagonica]